ncbi:MAG: hypothetical protein LCH30_01435 [Proteobacteria bacterium]|nr:hypothetical protein [Pseudomonadota bacterium]
MLKKTTLAILGLAASAYASTGVCGTMGPVCTPGNVTVPCETKQWDISADALYLKPVYSADRGFAYNGTNTLVKTEPKWGWGFKLQGAYHFHTGNDISISWTRYHDNAHRNNLRGFTNYAPLALPYQLNQDNRFDQVNVVLGQHVDMSAYKKMRFFGGLQYAKIRVDETNRFVPLPALLRIATNSQEIDKFRNAEFYGVGPTVGVDYAYMLWDGLSLTANSAISILYGTSRYNQGYVFSPTGLVTNFGSHTEKTLVPSFEGKLGLNYGYQIAEGILNIDAGYQVINYFDALQTRGQIGLLSSKGSSNFGLYGPYFGAKWVGNV